MERDRESIGLSADGQRCLAELEGKGWFPEKHDIARFCLAYAVRLGVPDGVTTGTDTRWAAGNFDKSGELRALLLALYPKSSTPIRLMEHLVNEGLRLVSARVETGGGLAELLGSASLTAGRPTTLFGRYEVLHVINGGGMAQTFCVSTAGRDTPLFLKRVALETLNARALEREQRIYAKLQMMNDPALVRVVDWVRDDHHAALVTEYAGGGNLADHVRRTGGRLNVDRAKTISTNVLESLRVLHAADIVHRDIKPENVVLVGSTWKLTDFGIAKNAERPQSQHTFARHHTPGYAPPEQVEGAEAHPAADVYAFGKLLVFMLSGQTDPDQIITPACRALVRNCTQPQASARPTLEEVRRAVEQLV